LSPVLWANFGPLSGLVARSVNPVRPPVLVISLPRSGSSWVGSTLGRSPSALYLREPISQPYLLRHQRRGVVFSLDPQNLPDGYRDWGDRAFAGIPAFTGNVVQRPRDWRLSQRRNRRVVVKEVNPLALSWLLERYRPRVIYLMRHPAAVASSFARLGWMNEDIRENEERRFSAARMGLKPDPSPVAFASAWAEHADLQARIMKIALEALRSYGEKTIVEYETICAAPADTFRSLYDFCGLDWSDEVARTIEAQTGIDDHNRFESYSLFRNSSEMPDSWRADVNAAEIENMKAAFLAHGLPHYGAGAW